MRRTTATLLIPAVLAASGCTARKTGSPVPSPAASASTGATLPAGTGATLPAGWRWESYAGVEVGVPSDWGWGNGSQRISQWCVHSPTEGTPPIVGRPGSSTLVGCGLRRADAPAPSGPDPQTLVANTGLIVSLERRADSPVARQAGDQTQVRLDDVLITVNAPQPLRDRIVATVHQVSIDDNGCPSTDPISRRPLRRPLPAVAVTALRKVSSVSACRYELASGLSRQSQLEPRLISSLRLRGITAGKAIRAIAQAPLGGGLNVPQNCAPNFEYGEEGIVLRVQSAAGPTEIVLRYSGCDGAGFDDGVSLRTLTTPAVRPFITGSNTPDVTAFGSGDAKQAILEQASR